MPRLLQYRRAWKLPPVLRHRPLDSAVALEDVRAATGALFSADRMTRLLVHADVDAVLGPPAGRYPGQDGSRPYGAVRRSDSWCSPSVATPNAVPSHAQHTHRLLPQRRFTCSVPSAATS